MVDTSGSQRAYIADEIAAGRAFFPAMMSRTDDRAVLIQFDNRILRLVDFTSNTATLEHGLAYLTQSHNDIGQAGRGGTLLFDAIIAASHLELGTQLGRRAIVILTDGGDNGSQFNAKHAIEEAQRADIMIYTIYYSNGGGDEGVLKELSKATGGREFSVDSKMTLQQIYAEIASDLRLEYELGYRNLPIQSRTSITKSTSKRRTRNSSSRPARATSLRSSGRSAQQTSGPIQKKNPLQFRSGECQLEQAEFCGSLRDVVPHASKDHVVQPTRTGWHGGSRGKPSITGPQVALHVLVVHLVLNAGRYLGLLATCGR